MQKQLESNAIGPRGGRRNSSRSHARDLKQLSWTESHSECQQTEPRFGGTMGVSLGPVRCGWSLLRVSQAEIKVSARLTACPETLGGLRSRAHPGCQSSVSCGCRAEAMFPCWLSVSQGCSPSVFKPAMAHRILLVLRIIDFLFCNQQGKMHCS